MIDSTSYQVPYMKAQRMIAMVAIVWCMYGVTSGVMSIFNIGFFGFADNSYCICIAENEDREIINHIDWQPKITFFQIEEKTHDEHINHRNDNEWVDFRVTYIEHRDSENTGAILTYEITNRCDFGIRFSRIELLHNGRERESVFRGGGYELEKGSTIQSRAVVRHGSRNTNDRINPGDTLVVRATVSLYDLNEHGSRISRELGRVRFEITVGQMDEPGSRVTNPEHIRVHDDISMLITSVGFRSRRGDIATDIELLMINSNNLDVRFDDFDVYVNGVKILEDEFWGTRFSIGADSGTSARRELAIYVPIELGDTLTLRGTLQFLHEFEYISEETVEISFVL